MRGRRVLTIARRRRRAARRSAWRCFSRLLMNRRRRRASCSTPSRCTILLKRRMRASGLSCSLRLTSSMGAQFLRSSISSICELSSQVSRAIRCNRPVDAPNQGRQCRLRLATQCNTMTVRTMRPAFDSAPSRRPPESAPAGSWRSARPVRSKSAPSSAVDPVASSSISACPPVVSTASPSAPSFASC